MAFALIAAIHYRGDYRMARLASEGLRELPCELPEGSILFGDKAYTSYSLEDDLLEMAQITLILKTAVKNEF